MLRLNDDRGAAAVVVALVVAALFIPTTAIVVDVGGMYSERRRLQNSADAGAMATALSCAKGTCDTTQANTFAQDNNVLGADVESGWPCGTMGSLPSCIPDTRCEAQPDAGVDYVELLVTSEGEWEPMLLPAAKKNVPACARATLTAPSGGKAMAMTVSGCEWDLYTADRNGDGVRDYGPYSTNPKESALIMQEGSGSHANRPASCVASDENSGAFGWLKDFADEAAGDECQADIDEGTYNGDPGSSLTDQPLCIDALKQAYLSHEPIFFPVYETYNKTGKTYTLRGFASFVVTAFSFQGSKDKPKSWLTGNDVSKGKTALCGSSKCVVGYFTEGLLPGGSGSGTVRGTTSVNMIL